MAWEDKTYKS